TRNASATARQIFGARLRSSRLRFSRKSARTSANPKLPLRDSSGESKTLRLTAIILPRSASRRIYATRETPTSKSSKGVPIPSIRLDPSLPLRRESALSCFSTAFLGFLRVFVSPWLVLAYGSLLVLSAPQQLSWSHLSRRNGELPAPGASP